MSKVVTCDTCGMEITDPAIVTKLVKAIKEDNAPCLDPDCDGTLEVEEE